MALKVYYVKYLRHGPTLYWLLIVAAFGALFVSAINLSKDDGPTVVRAHVAPDETPYVIAMLNRITQVRAVSVDPAQGLNAWGAETADMALQDAQRRAAVAGEDDPVALAYASIALDAQGFATVDESDNESILVLRGRIGISYDRLVAAAQGIKVPGLPDSPNLVDGNGGDSTVNKPQITSEEEK